MKRFLLTLVVFFACTLITLSQWTEIGGPLSGLAGGSPRICVVDSNVVWVAGGVGTSPQVYRTVDGGANWVSIPTTDLPYFLTCIAANDTLTAFVADVGGSSGSGGNAKFFKTTDAGLNWTVIDSTGGTLGFYNDIQFSKSNPQFGIAMSDPADGFGGPFIVNKTTDGGVTWVKTNPLGVPNSYGLYYTAYAIDPQFYGFAVWDNATEMFSYTTTDGGNTWSLGDSSIATLNWGDIVFNDDKQHGVMVGYEWPDIKITSNGGVNWVRVNTGTDIHGFSTARWISGTDVVFICAHISSTDRKIIRSDDNGITWQQQNTPPYMAVRELDFARYGNSIIGFAITSDGHVLKSVQTVNLTGGIADELMEVPKHYSLFQNYPNPFNPATKIKYQIPERCFVTIRVYDVLGSEVKSLINEEKDAGSYEIHLNGLTLPSGVYFYRIQAGNFIHTKKMILLK